MNPLQLMGLLKSFGYDRFIPQGEYLHSGLTYTTASFQNKMTDPVIVNLPGPEGFLRVWKDNMYDILEPLDWDNSNPDSDVIRFKPNLFINDDGFVISVNVANFQSLLSYRKVNVFRRPVIRGTDDRYDLGDRTFIVSNAGLLFSLYEAPLHKTLKFDDTIHLFDDQYKPNGLTTFEIQETLIGSYEMPIRVKVIHVLPKGSFWNPRKYVDWE